MVSALNTALDEAEADIAYVTEQMRGPQRHNVSKIATILRKGILDKVLSAGDAEDDTLAERVVKFRQSKSEQLAKLISIMEPRLSEKVKDLLAAGRTKLMTWVCFALGVKETTNLPNTFPTLRSFATLAEYCIARHDSIGRRLAPLASAEDLSNFALPGYFTILLDEGAIQANYMMNEGQPARIQYDFDGKRDWTLTRNYVTDATVTSSSKSTFTGLKGRFLADLGIEMPLETGDWDLPLAALPASVVGPPAAAVAPATADAASAARSGGDGGAGAGRGGARPPPPAAAHRQPPSARRRQPPGALERDARGPVLTTPAWLRLRTALLGPASWPARVSA